MFLDKVISQWNKAAVLYSNFESTSKYSALCRDFAANHYYDVKGLKILDAGCGNGSFTHILSENGGNVTGFDGSKEMIKIARSKYPTYQFDLADMSKTLPYDNKQFDLVFCNLVLMDIDPIDNAIDEISRVTKKNGIFFFSIVHPAFYHAKWEKDETGHTISKKVTGYITQFEELQSAWGETMHYHRPISFYFNKISAKGFSLKEMYEPEVYEDTKIPDIPLYLFAEFKKIN